MAGEGESVLSTAISTGIEQVAEFLLACSCAALLWHAGSAASRFTSCHAPGVSHCTVLLPEALL